MVAKVVSLVGIIGTMSGGVFKIKSLWVRYTPLVQPIVEDVEQRAADGRIDKDDRKALALHLIKELETSGNIKLNFITRFIISRVIDCVAQKLPDFEVTKKNVELARQSGKG